MCTFLYRHSVVLSYDRSIASSKPHSSDRPIYYFLFPSPVSFCTLSSYSRCLRLLLPVPVASVFPSIFRSVTCCRRQFLHNMWPIQLAFLPFVLCRILLSSFTLYNIYSFFTRWLQLFVRTLRYNRSVHVSAPCKSLLRCSISPVSLV
jgi:hypothetical protein